jgi:hypothetical protein
MLKRSTSTAPTQRRQAVHVAAALVAGGAIVLLPLAWPWTGLDAGLATWWPAAAAVIASALAYATITAILHFRLARYSHLATNPLELAADAALLIESCAILWRGAESRLLLAGLVLVPPVLIALSGASLLVLLSDRRRKGSPAESTPRAVAFYWRVLAAIALVAAVAWLESFAVS